MQFKRILGQQILSPIILEGHKKCPKILGSKDLSLDEKRIEFKEFKSNKSLVQKKQYKKIRFQKNLSQKNYQT